jgi:small ligand-binding sensory domain FIST
VRTAAALSHAPEGGIAAAEAADAIGQELPVGTDLVVVFVSPDHLDEIPSVVAAIETRLEPGVVIGAVAQGVIGPSEEVEAGPAVSLWAADLDGERPEPFRAWSMRTSDGGMAVAGWPDPDPARVTLVLADPYSFPTAEVVTRIGQQGRRHRIVGGLVTGGPGRSRLIADDRIHEDGAVGVLLPAGYVSTVVSHGCRPVGQPFTVTAAERNRILGLGGEPATDRLQQLVEQADEADRALLRSGGLHVGLVMDLHQEEYDTGDFRIRGVLGVDPEAGAITVGDLVEVGQVVQFQVRDGASASADLDRQLARVGPSAGGLLFTCNGRGRRLFGVPDHDVTRVQQTLGVPIAGAFCAGEIGPVGDRSELHGFTASLLVFEATEG